MTKWFEKTPIISEELFRKETEFDPWEYRKINGVWINVYKGWVETPAGILIWEEK